MPPLGGHISSGMAPPPGFRHAMPNMAYPPFGPVHHHPHQPVMSNIHQPGGQMTLLGSVPTMSQYGSLPHGNMLIPHGHQNPHNERPFKCDLCPQSFNRNHDLKRHKRIHLSVKPFPCNHCEKSFSRKDALKVSAPKPDWVESKLTRFSPAPPSGQRLR